MATAATPPLHVAKERQKKKRPDLAPGPDLSLQGKAKAGYLKPWTDALKKARENLGITGNKVCATKDTDYYKEAKRLQREGT